MQDSIFRLESNTVDVVVKTHPFAEILYWGAHLQHFSPQDVLSNARPVLMAGWTSTPPSR